MRKFGVVVTVIAVASLVAVLGAGLVLGATVTVAEDDVEWATSDSEGISSIRPNVTGVFFIFDDALESTKAGTAVFSGIPRIRSSSISPPEARVSALPAPRQV